MRRTVLALVALTRERPSAAFWLTCAGSAGLYLFGMDFRFAWRRQVAVP